MVIISFKLEKNRFLKNYKAMIAMFSGNCVSTHQRSRTSALTMLCVTGRPRLCPYVRLTGSVAARTMTGERTRTQKTVTVTWQMSSPGWRRVPMCDAEAFVDVCIYIYMSVYMLLVVGVLNFIILFRKNRKRGDGESKKRNKTTTRLVKSCDS